jgi:glycyl-tRNA synthetase beta chain
LAARLNDARYFWDLDRKASLESRVPKLDTLVYHQKLLSMGHKVARIIKLAGTIAPLVGAEVADAQHAAKLAKADLTTEMVGEFPELQGVMGRYYQLNLFKSPELEQETNIYSVGASLRDQNIADAIRDHYKPVGPSDQVPSEPVAMAVALADKFDTMTGFFAIHERPTGSGDPFALRRAALGVIRIVREGEVRFGLAALLNHARRGYDNVLNFDAAIAPHQYSVAAVEVCDFILERLRVSLRDEGFAPDVLEAAFAIPDDDIVRIVARVTALAKVLKTEDGANLVAGLKRGANILRAEEKKDGAAAQGIVSDALLAEPAEQGLHQALVAAESQMDQALAAEAFDTAMSALAGLRGPVDRFFEAVLVNDSDPAIRQNRLALLVKLRAVSERVADFSKLAGA